MAIRRQKHLPLAQGSASQKAISIFSVPLTTALNNIEQSPSVMRLPQSLAGGVVVKLRGYSSANREVEEIKRYNAAKRPMVKDWTNPEFKGMSPEQVEAWDFEGGWTGVRIPPGVVTVDIDDPAEGELIYKLLLEEGLTFNARRTPNGYQFDFKDTGNVPTQDVKVITTAGFQTDYRVAGKGQVVLPSRNTPGREWLRMEDGELSPLPVWLEPMCKAKKDKTTNDYDRPITFPIMEGQRNDTLFKHACRLFSYGKSEKDVRDTLKFMSKRLCVSKSGKPERLPETELDNIVLSARNYREPEPAISNASETKNDNQVTQTQVLISLAQEEAHIFASPDGQAFAKYPVRGHTETWPIKHRKFLAWLSVKYYDKFNKPCGKQPLADAITHLEFFTLNSGLEEDVYVRVAECNRKIYVDLANEDWEVAEIDSDGWRILSSSPVNFRRPRGLLALPTPTLDGSINDLRQVVNVTDENWPLFACWLVFAFNPIGPYPILVLQGTHGSAKTTHSLIARSLICPNISPLRSIPKDERDLMIAAKNSWVLNFDNLSGTPPWLSDALCRLSTGGGLSTRELYSNDEEALFTARRPVIINGIDDLATRADFGGPLFSQRIASNS